MKKTVKLLSFVLLVSMLFSMMAVSASAIVSDTPAGNGGGIVLGGGGNATVNPGGSLIIGGDQRPEDDSPFTGVHYDEDVQEQARQQAVSNAQSLNAASVETYAMEAAAKYMKKADGDYSGILDSEYDLVQENQDFLMYIRDNLDTVDASTLQTALDLFGDTAVYGTGTEEVDEEAVEERKEEISVEQDTLSAQIDELKAKLEAIEAGYEDDAFMDNEEYQSLDAQYTALVNQFNELQAENDGIDQFMSNPIGLMAAPKPEQITSNFGIVCPGYSSLAEAVSGSNYNTVLKFTANSFDICNSTDYRITVDLHAATIDARQSPAAFTIRPGRYGGTVTFTNGTIIGDGFYVAPNGVLNLGGLVNGNYIDISVYAVKNAVYVEEGGTAVIGQGTTLVGGIPGTAGTNPADYSKIYKTDNTRYTHYSNDPVVEIRPGGSVKMTGGIIVCGSVDGTGAARKNNYGVHVMGGGRFEMFSSVAEVYSKNPAAPAIYGESGSTIDIHGGYIYGPTGIAVEGSSTTLTVNGGAITGYGAKMVDAFPNASVYADTCANGAAIAVKGDATKDSPLVYVNGGTLRSEYTAAVTTVPRATDRNAITRIAVDDVNVAIQEMNGDLSDYARAIFIATVDGSQSYGFSTIDALNDFIKNVAANTVEIKMIADAVTKKEITFNNATSTIVFDGNGHRLRTTNAGAIIINQGDVTIKNVTLDGDHTGKFGITASGGSTHIGPNVTVGHYTKALDVTGAGTVVTVNGLDIEGHNEKGIVTDGKSEVIVYMCKNDSRIPVESVTGSTGYLRIEGGWFAYKQDEDAPGNALRKVATYVDPDYAYVKYVEKDRYYEVLYNDTPNVEIDTTITTRYGNEPQPDGTVIPYIVYDKSNPDPIVFKEVAPKLVQIDAVGIITKDGKVVETGSVYPIFTAEKGRTGTIRIPDRAVLEDLPSGRYDLRFTFHDVKTGYVMQDKLRLYVFPKYAGLFAVPNTKDISPSMGADNTVPATTEIFNGNIVEYLNNNFDLIKTKTAYPIGAIGWNVAIVTSELPDKVTIGNAADNTNSILLENYIYNGLSGNYAEDRTTWGVVPSGPYKDYYFYIISYADLNNLSAGQNWVFLNWNGMDGALKNLPLTIKNDYVSISPTTVKWSKINGDVTFTIRPTCDAVYIDGELVPSGYWTYDPSTHVMTLKGTYLGAMDAKDHMLEVVTGLGKASATITTGMGLMANGIDYHVYGQNRVVSFAASDRINQDGGVWIGSSNPTRLDPSAYTWNGTNGFTLNSAFLNRLALGTYYISAYVYNGSNGYNYTTTTFRVISATQASNNPATGDDSNITLWLVILALSAVAIVVIAVPQFKKKKGMH